MCEVFDVGTPTIIVLGSVDVNFCPASFVESLNFCFDSNKTTLQYELRLHSASVAHFAYEPLPLGSFCSVLK